MSNIPFHLKIADLTMKLMAMGTNRIGTAERIEGHGTIVQIESIEQFQVPGEIFISSADIYDDLPISAIKLILRIQKELMYNNPLWECPDKSDSNVRAAIAKLRRRDILIPIEKTDLYIVNPLFIRKGRALSIYAALWSYSYQKCQQDKNWKPTREDLRPLLAPKKIEIPTLLKRGN